MNKPLVIVSSCGTSLWTNPATEPLRDQLNCCTNDNGQEFASRPEHERETVNTHLEEVTRKLAQADIECACRMSAELNGIVTFFDRNLPPKVCDRPVMHFLIHSDTYLGERAANAVAEWLRAQGQTSTSPTPIKGMNTRRVEDYETSMTELIKWCHETLPKYQKSGYHIVFNLVGGFKALQGYMQTLGMFYADETIYLFERGGELLRIPRLSIRLAYDEEIQSHLDVFRRLEAYDDGVPVNEVAGLSPLLFFHPPGDRVMLSAWGELVWNQTKDSLLGKELLEPLSKHLIYAEPFRREFDSLERDRKVIVNQRLDQLARYLDSGMRDCPSSLSFKKLAGKPVRGSTHECYAWSDQDARRLFGHFEGEQFVVDALESHL